MNFIHIESNMNERQSRDFFDIKYSLSDLLLIEGFP